MQRKMIAAVAVVSIAPAAVPASASASAPELCPPGTTNATYCALGNPSGLALLTHHTEASTGGTVKVRLRCETHSQCTGTLYLEASGGKIYGTVLYAIDGRTSSVLTISLTAAAQLELKRARTLAVTVTAVTGGVKSVLGGLRVSPDPPRHHAHHAHGKHGKH
jgi:hypothetical protein